MWFVFCVFFALWFLSVHFYAPTAMVFIFFTAAIAAATIALMPVEGRNQKS